MTGRLSSILTISILCVVYISQWSPRMGKADILESVVDLLSSDGVMETSQWKRTRVLSSESQDGHTRDIKTPVWIKVPFTTRQLTVISHVKTAGTADVSTRLLDPGIARIADAVIQF